MNKLTKINSFLFRKAEYIISDSDGNMITLKIDYLGEKYEIVKADKVTSDVNGLIDEVKMIAFDLISRKSNNNRVEALKKNK